MAPCIWLLSLCETYGFGQGTSDVVAMGTSLPRRVVNASPICLQH